MGRQYGTGHNGFFLSCVLSLRCTVSFERANNILSIAQLVRSGMFIISPQHRTFSVMEVVRRLFNPLGGIRMEVPI